MKKLFGLIVSCALIFISQTVPAAQVNCPIGKPISPMALACNCSGDYYEAKYDNGSIVCLKKGTSLAHCLLGGKISNSTICLCDAPNKKVPAGPGYFFCSNPNGVETIASCKLNTSTPNSSKCLCNGKYEKKAVDRGHFKCVQKTLKSSVKNMKVMKASTKIRPPAKTRLKIKPAR